MAAPDTIHVEVSPWRMLLVAGGAVVMAVLAGLIAFRILPIDDLSDAGQLGALAGVPFFGLCAAIAVWRVIALRGPVITLSPDGFRDVRVAVDLIPWTAIQGVTTWQAQGQRVMVLAVRPDVERRLALTPIARWTRDLNKRLRADGLAIGTTGLAMGYDELFTATVARVSAHRG